MQGVCHLLTNIGMYCKETLSSCPYRGSELDDTRNDSEKLPVYENMDLENLVFEKVNEEIEARKRTSQSIPFHFHMPEALSGLVEGTDRHMAYFTHCIYVYMCVYLYVSIICSQMLTSAYIIN